MLTVHLIYTSSLLCCIILFDCCISEVITHAGHDGGVDWWALAIFIFELLVGYTPFTNYGQTSNDLEIYENILSKKIEFPSGFPSAAASLIRKLTDAEPSKRFGWATGSIRDIKRHRWFRGFAWDQLESREMPAPHKPEVKGPADTSNFEAYKDEKKYQFKNDKVWDGGIDNWDVAW